MIENQTHNILKHFQTIDFAYSAIFKGGVSNKDFNLAGQNRTNKIFLFNKRLLTIPRFIRKKFILFRNSLNLSANVIKRHSNYGIGAAVKPNFICLCHLKNTVMLWIEYSSINDECCS